MLEIVFHPLLIKAVSIAKISSCNIVYYLDFDAAKSVVKDVKN